jgi:hypothetical protein
MNDTVQSPQLTIRPLRPDDLEAVVAIDQAIEGRPRGPDGRPRPGWARTRM